MNFGLIGKLPTDTIQFFKEEILKRRTPEPYQWVHFDTYLNDKFMEIFDNEELKVLYDENKFRFIQKAAVSEPGYGWRIHKDGIADKGAMNIALSCNPTDWVRWYDDDFINLYCLMNNIPIKLKLPKTIEDISSRNTDIFNYDDVPFTEERQQEVGDVYVIDTNTWHSFKCVGAETRIILQTKFVGHPSCEELFKSLSLKSFNNLIKNE